MSLPVLMTLFQMEDDWAADALTHSRLSAPANAANRPYRIGAPIDRSVAKPRVDIDIKFAQAGYSCQESVIPAGTPPGEWQPE